MASGVFDLAATPNGNDDQTADADDYVLDQTSPSLTTASIDMDTGLNLCC
jgi:hypothetical protein